MRLQKRKTIPIVEEIYAPIRSKHIRSTSRSYSIYGIVVSTPHWSIQLTKTSFTFLFCTLSVYIKATWFSQSPTTVLMIWTRFSDSDCKRSRPRNDNEFPKNFPGSLELVVVSKTTLLEQSSSAISSYRQPTGNTSHEMRDELLSNVGAQEGLDTSGYHVSSAIWTMLNSTVKMITWMCTLFLDRALILPFHRQHSKTWRREVQQKIPFCSTMRKTKKTLLQQQQHQSLRD